MLSRLRRLHSLAAKNSELFQAENYRRALGHHSELLNQL